MLAKCDICGCEAGRLLKANHRDRGRIKICEQCIEKESRNRNLIHTGGCGCC